MPSQESPSSSPKASGSSSRPGSLAPSEQDSAAPAFEEGPSSAGEALKRRRSSDASQTDSRIAQPDASFPERSTAQVQGADSTSLPREADKGLSPLHDDASAQENSDMLEREGEGPRKRRVPLTFLPNDIEASIRNAIVNSRAASMSSVPAPARKDSMNRSPARGFLQHMERFRQQRAMSVPENLRSAVHGPRPHHPSAGLDQMRRGSARAQQLALLASQARLASSGTTNAQMAMRTEKAVKAAMFSHVQDAGWRHRHSVASDLLAIEEGRSQEEEKEEDEEEEGLSDENIADGANAAESSRRAGRDTASRESRVSMTPDESVAAWSAAMSSPSDTSSFMESASEVARSWANGFYAFEKEWVDGALERERRRSSAVGPTDVQNRASAPPTLPHTSSSESVPTAELKEKPPLMRLPTVPATDKDWPMSTTSRSMAPLLAAQKRLSDAREEARNSLSDLAGRDAMLSAASDASGSKDEGEASGRLLDVLQNFASLLESRTEGCQGLERLALDARRLSAVPLPGIHRDSLAVPVSPTDAAASHLPAAAASSPIAVPIGNSPTSNA